MNNSQIAQETPLKCTLYGRIIPWEVEPNSKAPVEILKKRNNEISSEISNFQRLNRLYGRIVQWDVQPTTEAPVEVPSVQSNETELEELERLNVWSEHQNILEQQALKELEIFSEQNRSTTKNQTGSVANGKITVNSVQSYKKDIHVPYSSLNLEEYIKRQEELKKHLEHKKSLEVDQYNKKVAYFSSRKHLKSESDDDNVCVRTRHKRRKLRQHREKRSVADDESGSEYVPSEPGEYITDSEYESSDSNVQFIAEKKPLKVIDDGSYKMYKHRLKEYYKELENADRPKLSPEDIDVSGLKVPAKMWNLLYRYQQDGVEWLWKIHQLKSGGLLGDEMGLGKTVQVIVFLAALEHTRVFSSHAGLGPTLIVVPATVVHQWVEHFHEWAPEFRVAVLHHSGSFSGINKTHLIKEIHKFKGILITTYSGILRYKGSLADHHWHYLILDEGHKIRNSTAKVTIAIKQLRTPHRIMLTGSPMQNNLQELWSLFDFIVPGMLGTLPTFTEHFNNPIVQGGYTNATPMQEATALSVATALKSIISPHLLRRTKNEVKDEISLPSKSEQVLFCSLTPEQYDLYKGYLMSEHVSMILGRGGKNWFSEKLTRANVLVAITTLRKICNHPDLYLAEPESFDETLGYYKRSGKMVVVAALLKIWKKQNHRVLLFTQGRAMMVVFEAFLIHLGLTYLKMDGSTSVRARQPLINKFNTDSSYDVFLSTTRVGGLGINLTGANRVIIFDPDWNPATDTQARERVWRIGQEKQVTVYRLVSAGTIEEKMYQRQVWKQLLTNKVLIDPSTQKFFKTSDLHDLFSLPDQINESTLETANIFKNSRVNLQAKLDQKKRKKEAKYTESTDSGFSDEKLQAMKNLAQQIAKQFSNGPASADVIEKQTSYQKTVEEERLNRIQEKESLKTLTPIELRILNRKKLQKQIEPQVNKIDDSETDITFTKALCVCEKTAKLYTGLKSKKHNKEICSPVVLPEHDIVEECTEKHKKKKRDEGVIVDNSGEVDGVVIKGLVKREIKKKEKRKSKSSIASSVNQDQYVLERLFSKTGVHSALQHDVIVQSGYKDNNLKIHYEAQQRTDLALHALKKSRLEAWRW